MFGTCLTALIIAALAGAAAYFAWETNKAIALALGGVCLVASAVAILTAFLGALGLFFKLVPFLFLALGIWLVWRAISKGETSKNDTTSTVQR